MLHFYDASMAEAAERRFILDSEMRTALGENQFDLYLQPQVDEMGDVTGAEALIRWMHPSKGLVTPAAFIFQAERSGFIVPLSEWVLRHACGYIRKLQNGNLLPAGGHIAVNLSAKFFHQADFVYRTLSIVDEYGIDPGNIELELTEGTLLDNVDDAINKIYALKERGIRFSIDDFGTGYSSLAYVKRLPIDRLKIDRSFVHNIDSSPDDAAIVETILSIARHFNLEIIAEGVETAVEREFLQNLGCLAFQGYLFHRPMPFTEFQQLQLTGKRKQSA
jgi:EAL domain-containing protein (putative c-di-GMP-specific phosphodiesterase class I)